MPVNRKTTDYKRAQKYFNYNPETGDVTFKQSRGSRKAGDPAGKLTEAGSISITVPADENGPRLMMMAHRFAWYCCRGRVPRYIKHANGIRYDNRLENLARVTGTKVAVQ